MQHIFRLVFNLFLVAVCSVLSAVAVIENYLQLVAAFSLLNTDGMPISSDRGLPWLAALVPGEASLVEGMSLMMSLGFALGVFCTMRLTFQLPAYGIAVFQAPDREARRTLLVTAIQKAMLALGLATILVAVGRFEFELFTLRSIANALGEDTASETVLNLAPWSQGAAEYMQSYPLALSRLLPRAYLGIVVVAAVLFEISIADLGDAWVQCVGPSEFADAEDVDIDAESAADWSGSEDAVMTNADMSSSKEYVAAVPPQTSRAPEPSVPPPASEQPRETAGTAWQPAPAGDVQFSVPVRPRPAAPAAAGPSAAELVDIFGRPGQRISIANARLDPTLRVDPATRRVWDRAFEDALAADA